MKLSEIKAGDKLVATADWADCWLKGDLFTVHDHSSGLYVYCSHGIHTLDGMCDMDEDDEIPELEKVE